MKAIKIAENIYWVGVIDWNLRNFHGYLTSRGSTYNAYLILDEKVTLIDTVKATMTDEMLSRISSVIDPQKIDYIISNHTEMDHSGGLEAIRAIAPQSKIFASVAGEKGLVQHYRSDLNIQVAKSGTSLSLGKNNLQFVHTPMVHWPDNMVCYLPEEKILFSNDGFGQHLATSERFADECPKDIVFSEAKKYYANILLPYGQKVNKALEDIKALDIRMIATSHGVSWRSYLDEIIAEYQKWSNGQVEEKALIIYDSMWNSTYKIALAIQSAFEKMNISNALFDLKVNHISDIMSEVLTAKYICVGSPTLNSGIMSNVAAFLSYHKGLAPVNKIGLAFGSYGWGGQSIPTIDSSLRECGYTMMEPVKARYVPDEETLKGIQQKIEEQIKQVNAV